MAARSTGAPKEDCVMLATKEAAWGVLWGTVATVVLAGATKRFAPQLIPSSPSMRALLATSPPVCGFAIRGEQSLLECSRRDAAGAWEQQQQQEE